jgi:hypothetical protein
MLYCVRHFVLLAQAIREEVALRSREASVRAGDYYASDPQRYLGKVNVTLFPTSIMPLDSAALRGALERQARVRGNSNWLETDTFLQHGDRPRLAGKEVPCEKGIYPRSERPNA